MLMLSVTHVLATSVNGTVVGLAAALATAVVAALTFALTAVKQRRQSVADQVRREVEAQLGHTMVQLKKAEEQAQDRTDKAKQLEDRYIDLLGQIQQKGQELKDMTERATELLPALKRSKVVIPRILVGNANRLCRYESNTNGALSYLSELLASEGGSSVDYEMGGGLADSMNAHVLAYELFERAIKINPQNATARASLIEKKADLGRGDSGEIVQEADRYALAHPRDPVVLRRCFNACIALEDWEAVREIAEKLLQKDDDVPVTWRNFAVALDKTGAPAEKTSLAYQKAIDVTSSHGEEDLSNVLVPYVRYLLKYHRFEDAKSAVETLLRDEPRSSLLLRQYAEIMRTAGDPEKAQECYRIMVETADDESDQDVAKQGLADLAVLQRLEEGAIIEGSTRD